MQSNWHGIAQTFLQLGTAWGITSCILFLFGLLPMGLMGYMFFAGATDLWQRRRDKITVSEDGITFENASIQITSTWENVQSYQILPKTGFSLPQTCQITMHEGTFTFTYNLQNLRALQMVIVKHATEAKQTHWNILPDQEDVLGGEQYRWSSGCVGIGERIFHYRTRTLRALLWLLTLFAVLPWFSLALSQSGLAPRPSWTVIGLSTVIVSWCWWRYHTAVIQVSGEGIAQRTPWGWRHLRWDQIQQFATTGDDILKFENVIGPKTKIRFWIGIAHTEELQAEIARRAINAQVVCRQAEPPVVT